MLEFTQQDAAELATVMYVLVSATRAGQDDPAAVLTLLDSSGATARTRSEWVERGRALVRRRILAALEFEAE